MTSRGAALIAALLLPGTVGAVDVTTCGQVVESGQVGNLVHDLDCASGPGFPGSPEGVRLVAGAILQMNGFSIRGDEHGVGVFCGAGRRACTVIGPGVIRGFYAGLNGGGCRAALRGVVLHGNTYGVLGPLSCSVVVDHVNAVENTRDGIWAQRIRARTTSASHNGEAGVAAARIDARGLLATGNGAEGVRHSKFHGGFGRIVDSTVIGNGATNGYDITAVGRLRL